MSYDRVSDSLEILEGIVLDKIDCLDQVTTSKIGDHLSVVPFFVVNGFVDSLEHGLFIKKMDQSEYWQITTAGRIKLSSFKRKYPSDSED